MLLGWSAVWTILAFLLEGSEYGFGAPQVGLVALAGLGGVVSGQAGARLVGAVGEACAVRGAIVVAGLACLGLALSATSLVALLVALFVHNTAVWTIQAINVPAAARRAGPTEAARGTALLYLTNFICTGVGAVVGALVWSANGWPGIGLLAAACCAVSLGLEIVGRVAVDGGTDP